MTETAAGLVQSIDWLAVAPPTVTAVVGLVVLVADLFVDEARKAVLGWISVAGLALAALALLPLLEGDRSAFCRTDHPAVCSYTADHFAVVVQFLVLGGALLVALLSVSTLNDARGGGARGVRKDRSQGAGKAAARVAALLGSRPAPVVNDARSGAGRVSQDSAAGRPSRDDGSRRRAPGQTPGGASTAPDGEYWFLLLSSAAGAALLPAARDLATLVVALEVASLPAFALVGLRRGERRSADAALKFFLSSVTATAVTLLGASFVYAATGSLYLTEIAGRLGHVDGPFQTLARTGVTLTLVGFAFKTAAVPFHFWVPDTYVGAPLPVAAYLSVVGKAVGFSGLIVITVLGFPSYGHVWGTALAVLAALTMSAGNVAALRQRPTRAYSAVRLLAWSSVGQAGYLLVPIAAAGRADDPGRAIGSTIAYALMYAAVNLGAFAVAALVARSSPYNRLSDYRGLYASRPLPAALLGFFLLCLAGLPPGVIGLFAKVTVLSAAVDAGLGWLAVVMAVNVVIALYYYLQWTALLFREPAPQPASTLQETAASQEAVAFQETSSGPQASPEERPGSQTPPKEAPGDASGAAGADSVSTGHAPDSDGDDGSGTGYAGTGAAAPVPHDVPGALVLALTLTGLLALALSGAPQLVLRFSAIGLF